VAGTVAYLITLLIAFVNVTVSLALIVILALLFVLPEPGERRTTPKRTGQRGVR
jgi:hypothetical protein